MTGVLKRSRELFLLLCSAGLLLLMLFSLEMSQARALSAEMLYLVGGFVVVYAVAHVAIGLLAPYADQTMLPVVATLNAIGLVIIYRLDLAERMAEVIAHYGFTRVCTLGGSPPAMTYFRQ